MTLFDEHLIWEDAYFRAEHSGDCYVPGYLILSAKDPIASISGLTAAPQQNLGPQLALLVRALEAVVRPELVYCARFGEEIKALHFHLFPRTAELAKEFLASPRNGATLNGPLLLNWAREHYARVAVTGAQRAKVKEALHGIREYVNNHPI